jgi:hypothetical protein
VITSGSLVPVFLHDTDTGQPRRYRGAQQVPVHQAVGQAGRGASAAAKQVHYDASGRLG